METVDAFSIRIFLPDGDPTGLRLVSRSHWAGQLTICPREAFTAHSSRPEFDRTGVYLLTGPSDADPDVPQIYVGEADEIRTRVNQHLKTKDFWDQVVCFTKTDDSLNKADVRSIEAALIARAKEIGRYVVANATVPSPPAPPEAEKADIDAFLAQMLDIIPLLGVMAFTEPPAVEAPPAEEPEFNFIMAGCQGRGRLSPQGFVLIAGSIGRQKETDALSPGYRNLRERLLADGKLERTADGALIVARDVLLPNPTQAAVALYGGQVSGPQRWKDENGRSLADRLATVDDESA